MMGRVFPPVHTNAAQRELKTRSSASEKYFKWIENLETRMLYTPASPLFSTQLAKLAMGRGFQHQKRLPNRISRCERKDLSKAGGCWGETVFDGQARSRIRPASYHTHCHFPPSLGIGNVLQIEDPLFVRT
jgi:hypothetical protein